MCDPAERPPEQLLTRWLNEQDEKLGHEVLSSLINLHAEPLVRRIVGFKLSGNATKGRSRAAADVDDVCNDALRNLLSHLGGLKSGVKQRPMRNFGDYVAVTAFNACNEYFREKSPARYRLANKLRYLLTHSKTFALWETSDGREASGTAVMRGQELRANAAELERTRDICKESQGFIESVSGIFRITGAPLAFETLLELLAECTGVREARAIGDADDGAGTPQALEQIPGNGPNVEATLVGRQYVVKLWAEILGLPLHQRQALLLNLKDSAGGDIQLFDWLGVATVQQIAVALEIDAQRFAELWAQLPLDDAQIARELGIDRQDVINRRSSARKRLVHRMKEYKLEKK